MNKTLSLFIPESKRESMEWKFPGETSAKKLKLSRFHRKSTMLSIFGDKNGIILIDYLDSGATINSEYYSKLVQTARKKRRKSRLCDLFYLTDNASVHTSKFSTEVVKGCGLTALSRPPYSLNLAPSDFYLFTHLNICLVIDSTLKMI